MNGQIDHGIDHESETKILGTLKLLFPTAHIYLYGSRSQGTHQQFSDVDIAVAEAGKIRPGRIGEARAMLEASNIPYKIDIVDFNSVSKEMKECIQKKGRLWTDTR